MKTLFVCIFLNLFLLITPLISQAQTTVTLDYYFNNEYRKGTNGHPERFHYIWEDRTNSGFSLWGNHFRKKGIGTASLETAPTASKLKETSIYIIVDPDTKAETANPHFMAEQYIKVITDWVKSGGVLVLMANNSAKVELNKFNLLAKSFGITFSNDIHNAPADTNFETGAIQVPKDHHIFKSTPKIYLKDLTALKLSKSAKAVLKKDQEIVMATAKYGKGTVFAVGNPWLYNEFMNGKLPDDFNNDKAAEELTQWLLEQVPPRDE
jgi:hypothetical protein